MFTIVKCHRIISFVPSGSQGFLPFLTLCRKSREGDCPYMGFVGRQSDGEFPTLPTNCQLFLATNDIWPGERIGLELIEFSIWKAEPRSQGRHPGGALLRWQAGAAGVYCQLSTVNTLGIQQCVVRCFNDFAMYSSCSESRHWRAVQTRRF